MSQPVKLSDALILDARLAGEAQERSIAGQVEFWAKLGQSIDALLKGPQVAALRRASQTESLSARLESVDSPAGRARVDAYLRTRPYPHYKEGGHPGLLIRVDEDGTETTGRFVNRVFVQAEAIVGASRITPKSGTESSESAASQKVRATKATFRPGATMASSGRRSRGKLERA